MDGVRERDKKIKGEDVNVLFSSIYPVNIFSTCKNQLHEANERLQQLQKNATIL
jgi:hypothetical protein